MSDEKIGAPSHGDRRTTEKPEESARLIARTVVKSLQRGQTWTEATAPFAVVWPPGIREQIEVFAARTARARKAPRPYSVDRETFASNWSAHFRGVA